MAESYFSRPAIDLSSTLQQYAISEGIQTEVLQQEIYQNIPFTIPVISKGKETLTGYAKFGQELLSTFPVIQEQLSEQDGVSPSIGEVLEYSIDALICGGLENPSNIPAIELRKLEPEEALIHELMRNRKEILAIRTFRGLNKGLYVWALSHPFPQRAIAGVSLLADFLGNMREHGLEGNNAANISIFLIKRFLRCFWKEAQKHL